MDANSIILPALNIILAAVLGYLGTFLVQAVPGILEFIESKLGQANYTRVKTVAIDIWNKLEEDCRLGDLATSKARAFEQLLLERFPELTKDEINLFNKAIAGEVNKDKELVIAATADTSQTAAQVAAVIQPKYVAPDGTELVPASQV